MKKIVIFGAGNTGTQVAHKILLGGGNILFFVDNDSKKWQSKLEVKLNDQNLSFAIKKPKELLKVEFDSVILASMVGYEENLTWLLENGVEESKIQGREIELKIKPRINFLKNFSVKFDNLEGNVAEVGVFQGGFAKYINEYFKDKKTLSF